MEVIKAQVTFNQHTPLNFIIKCTRRTWESPRHNTSIITHRHQKQARFVTDRTVNCRREQETKATNCRRI